MSNTSLSRRGLIKRASAVTLLNAAAQFPAGQVGARPSKLGLFSDGKFPDGVMSGDPTMDSITLWTRLDEIPERPGKVVVEVAKDRAFQNVVAHKKVAASPASGHTVKVQVKGLKPYERYYYRFETKDSHSAVGRTQTALPPDSLQPVRFAFFSCQDYTHGYYNAHELMVKEDLDFVLNLGDYIYADRQHTGATAVRDDPIEQARTLQQFRAKYRLYRSDPALRRMHAAFPMVSTWDDHEITDNYAGRDPEFKAFKKSQVAAGYRAFFENMPTLPAASQRIYRSLRFGKNVELIVLDERQHRDHQPCNDTLIVSADTCKDLTQPRRFLGPSQMAFLKSRLSTSQATWKTIANELLTEPIRFKKYTLNVDSWAGYQVEREELMGFLANQGILNTVFLTGDIHIFSAGHVLTAKGVSVATEFAGGSVTSLSIGEQDVLLPGEGTFLGNDQAPKTSQQLIDLVKNENPWSVDIDTDLHGYGIANVHTDRFEVSFRRLQTIKRKSTQTVAPLNYRVDSGTPQVIKLP